MNQKTSKLSFNTNFFSIEEFLGSQNTEKEVKKTSIIAEFRWFYSLVVQELSIKNVPKRTLIEVFTALFLNFSSHLNPSNTEKRVQGYSLNLRLVLWKVKYFNFF